MRKSPGLFSLDFSSNTENITLNQKAALAVRLRGELCVDLGLDRRPLVLQLVEIWGTVKNAQLPRVCFSQRSKAVTFMPCLKA